MSYRSLGLPLWHKAIIIIIIIIFIIIIIIITRLGHF